MMVGRKQGPRARAFLDVEVLEDRCLLSASPASLSSLAPGPSPLAPSQVFPNDPSFGSQYALSNIGQSDGTPGADINAPAAWAVTTGSMKTVVAVIDSGIDYDHADLFENIWLNQAEIPKSRLKNLTDIDHDGLITFRDLNNPINQGPGKITDVNHDGRIDAGDILAPMILDNNGRDTGLGGWAYRGNTQDGDRAHPNDFIGWNFVDNTNDPFDDNGHGTHVAGIIGAMGNNGIGVTGIDWNVQLMDLKFLDAQATGDTDSAIAAVNYAVAHGARISNNSWGGGNFDPALQSAIQRARAHGDIFVAAAGNGPLGGTGGNNDLVPEYPAGYSADNVVSVAATDRNDQLASFSNYGLRTVDLAAPGVDILSTTPHTAAAPDGTYSYFSGTSMAAPQVTGALALVEALHPDWGYARVIQQVLDTVDPLPSLAGRTVSGGRLDAAAAVGAGPADTIGPHVVSAVPNATGAGPVSSVRFTFSEAIDLTSFTPADVIFTGPRGLVRVGAVKVIPGTGDRQFEVSFPLQRIPGTYSLVIGPDIRDLSRNPMDQNGNGVNGEVPGDRYAVRFTIAPVATFVNNTRAAIRDLANTISTITITGNVTIADLSVKVNVAHTNDSNLYIYLRGPDGTVAVLSNHRGGPGDPQVSTWGFSNTVFDDEARTAVGGGRAPFAGSFRPETPLSVFDGKSARGAWQLWVEDRARGNVGVLNGWSLSIEAPGGKETAT